MKNTKTRTVAALVGVLALPAVAFAGIELGNTLGVSDEDIRAALEAEGYAVEEIEREVGEIEVEVTRDGQRFEIEIEAENGAIVGMEVEDDHDDDDDDDDAETDTKG